MDPNNQSSPRDQEIIMVIAERLGVPVKTITRDSYLFEDLNASKLEIADIIQTLEEKYEFKFAVEEVKTFQTVGHIIDNINDNVD